MKARVFRTEAVRPSGKQDLETYKSWEFELEGVDIENIKRRVIRQATKLGLIDKWDKEAIKPGWSRQFKLDYRSFRYSCARIYVEVLPEVVTPEPALEPALEPKNEPKNERIFSHFVNGVEKHYKRSANGNLEYITRGFSHEQTNRKMRQITAKFYFKTEFTSGGCTNGRWMTKKVVEYYSTNTEAGRDRAIEASPTRCEYDGRPIYHHKIDESEIPEGSTVIDLSKLYP